VGKLNKNESGFSAVEGLLILIIIGIVGFVGWYVLHAKQTANKTLSSSSSSTAKTSGTKSFTSAIARLSFDYPGSANPQGDSNHAGKLALVSKGDYDTLKFTTYGYTFDYGTYGVSGYAFGETPCTPDTSGGSCYEEVVLDEEQLNLGALKDVYMITSYRKESDGTLDNFLTALYAPVSSADNQAPKVGINSRNKYDIYYAVPQVIGDSTHKSPEEQSGVSFQASYDTRIYNPAKLNTKQFLASQTFKQVKSIMNSVRFK